MDAHVEQGPANVRGGRSERELDLDLEIAMKVEEYRWVEWNRAALADAPLYEPGRFVGHPGEPLSHLQVESSSATPLASRPYRRLPRYCSEPGSALRAAERAGVFADGGAVLSCTGPGSWRLEVGHAGFAMTDECLPRLLCRAALHLIRAADGEEAPAAS